MKKDEIQIGGTYLIKVSNQLVPVKVTGGRLPTNLRYKFIGTNLKTNRQIEFTAARCRRELNDAQVRMYLG